MLLGCQLLAHEYSYDFKYTSTSLFPRGLFRLSGRLGNGERGNKAHGSWGEEKRKLALPVFPHALPIFQFLRFRSLSQFSRYLSTEGASAEERDTSTSTNYKRRIIQRTGCTAAKLRLARFYILLKLALN